MQKYNDGISVLIYLSFQLKPVTMDNSKSLTSSIVNAKGLSNLAGHNNCFLNSAVQVFWHLDVFRNNFLSMKYHSCLVDSCIYCSLQEIFREFRDSEEDVLQPDMLRVTLSVAFQDQFKFQLGELDDASECYEDILSRIHFHLTQGSDGDCCSHKHCITHAKFSMSLIQQSECLRCGATLEPLSFVQLVQYVPTSSILEAAVEEPGENFGKVLRHAFKRGLPASECPVRCGSKCRTTNTLVNLPDVISIGLIWNSDQPSADYIKEFIQSIETELCIKDLFDNLIEETRDSQRVLVGVVCYYLKHYSTFFFHSKKKVWISFDDASVNVIGDSWENVKDKCCKGKYQPLLLIYQNLNARPIDTFTAPQKTTRIKKSFGTKKSRRINSANSIDSPFPSDNNFSNSNSYLDTSHKNMSFSGTHYFISSGDDLNTSQTSESGVERNGYKSKRPHFTYPFTYAPQLIRHKQNFPGTVEPVGLNAILPIPEINKSNISYLEQSFGVNDDSVIDNKTYGWTAINSNNLLHHNDGSSSSVYDNLSLPFENRDCLKTDLEIEGFECISIKEGNIPTNREEFGKTKIRPLWQTDNLIDLESHEEELFKDKIRALYRC